MAFWNSWKKWKKIYRDRKMATFRSINQQYALGITDGEFFPIAKKWGDDKAQSKKKWYHSFFSGNPLKAWANLIVSIGSVWLTWGATLWLNLANLASTIALNISGFYGLNASARAINLSLRKRNLEDSLNAQKALNDSKSTNAQLTQSLIWNPYEIFANGSVYKANQAGDLNTLSPSFAPFCGKGLLGEQHTHRIDEFIQNRAQLEKGGGEGHFNALVDLPFPLAKGGLSLEQIQDGHKNHFMIDQKRVNEGFNALLKEDLNYIGTAEAIYDKVYDAQLYPFFVKMQTWDCLDKLKYYNRALCQDFNYQNAKILDPREKKRKNNEPTKDLKEVIQSYQTQMKNAQTSEEREGFYAQAVRHYLSVFQEIGQELHTYHFQRCSAEQTEVLEYPTRNPYYTLVNAKDYYLDLAGFYAQKEALLKEVCNAKTLLDYEAKLSSYNALKPKLNPKFTPQWQRRIPNLGVAPLKVGNKSTPDCTSFVSAKGLELRFVFAKISNRFDFEQGKMVSTTNPLEGEKGGKLQIKLPQDSKEAIEYYECFIKGCFVETFARVNGKNESNFFILRLPNEPYFAFVPLSLSQFQALNIVI